MNGIRLIDYLGHMLEASNLAYGYVKPLSKDEFLADKRTQQAVILNLIVIGEAASKMLQSHEAFLDRHPEVPWRSMKGMRNRMTHGYFDINLEVVWDTVTTALPVPTMIPPFHAACGRRWHLKHCLRALNWKSQRIVART